MIVWLSFGRDWFDSVGFAKLKYDPGLEFMDAFEGACMALELQGFNPHELANVLNGESDARVEAHLGMLHAIIC